MPLKRGLDKWLSEEKVEQETKTELVQPSPKPQTASFDRSPGINCPKCGHKFPVTIEQLLTSESIICPSCALKLELNKEKSKEALEAMEKLYKTLKK